MTDISSHQHSFGVSHQREADGPFLRRILIGLIAATIFSGAVTFTLTTQQELIDGLLIASTYGPA